LLTIQRPRLTIRKANGEKINTIYNANNIVEDLRFGEINTLSFDVPYYLLDANGNAILNEDGTSIKNDKIDILIAEYIVEIEDRVYIIKKPSEKKDRDGYKEMSVQCDEMSSDLGFKQVKYLNLYPPYSNPVDPKRAILEVITYPYQKDLGYGNFTNVSGTSLTLGVDTSFNFNGSYIAILDGAGEYQQRKIISYNTGSKVAVVDSVFSPQVDTSTSLFRVHNSRFLLGDVDSDIMIVDGNPVFRSFEFQDTTIQDALQTVRARFSGRLAYATNRDSVENKYFVTIGLKNNNGVSGYEFRYRKNLNGISRDVDSSNSCYTRVYPEGRNNLSINEVATKTRVDSGTLYNSHELGQGDVYNFQYYLGLGYTIDECYDLFVKDFRFIEDAYVDADDLYHGASQALEELSVPKIDYKINGIDFSKLDLDIFVGINVIDLKEGDIVRVIDNELGFNFSATIINLKRNYDEPYKPQIELTNFTDTLGDIYLKVIKYQEGYSQRKSLYGKSATVVMADKATSRNWRYADYVVPDDGSKTANEILQFAVDEVSADGGGDIYVAEGNYGFAIQVNLKDNVNVYGYGVATRIYPIGSPSLAFSVTSKSNASVNNLFIDFRRDIDNITAISHFQNGVGIYTGSDSISVSNCKIEGITNNYIIAIESSNISILGNTMQSLVYIGINTEVIDLKACTNANVFRNRIYGEITAINSINITNQVGVSSGEFFIQDNYIRLFGSDGLGLTGIRMTVGNDAYVSVSDNTMITEGEAIIVTGIITTTYNFDIYNNVLHITTPHDGNGVVFYGGSLSVPVKGNVKNNSFNIASVIGTSGLSYDRTAVFFSSISRDIVFQNNKVTGINMYDTVNTTPLLKGMYIQAGSTNNVVSGNDLSENITTAIDDNGIGTLTLGGNKL